MFVANFESVHLINSFAGILGVIVVCREGEIVGNRKMNGNQPMEVYYTTCAIFFVRVVQYFLGP